MNGRVMWMKLQWPSFGRGRPFGTEVDPPFLVQPADTSPGSSITSGHLMDRAYYGSSSTPSTIVPLPSNKIINPLHPSDILHVLNIDSFTLARFHQRFRTKKYSSIITFDIIIHATSFFILCTFYKVTFLFHNNTKI